MSVLTRFLLFIGALGLAALLFSPFRALPLNALKALYSSPDRPERDDVASRLNFTFLPSSTLLARGLVLALLYWWLELIPIRANRGN
jgi:hypothetical protein